MSKNNDMEKTNNASEPSATDKVKKEIDELLMAAKEIAAGIIEDAKKEAAIIRGGSVHAGESKPVADELPDEVKSSIARGEELVEVNLFRDSGKYSDDVYVSVNGENCIIKRGEPVRVKRKFKEVLDNSMAQDNKAADMRKELSNEYEEKTKKLG